jgi:hypothetical protein
MMFMHYYINVLDNLNAFAFNNNIYYTVYYTFDWEVGNYVHTIS